MGRPWDHEKDLLVLSVPRNYRTGKIQLNDSSSPHVNQTPSDSDNLNWAWGGERMSPQSRHAHSSQTHGENESGKTMNTEMKEGKTDNGSSRRAFHRVYLKRRSRHL